MNMKKLSYSLLSIAVLGLMITAAHAGDCEHSRNLERSLELNSLNQLSVEAGAGILVIQGESGQKNITIKAKLCSSDKDILDEMDVVARLTDEKVQIVTRFPKSSWLNNKSAHIDLSLVVPSSMSLEVKDSSGEANVSNVAALDMQDSSGRLEIEKIAGDLKVTDSSGELVIRGVGGDVELTDSSGGIYVKNIEGSLLIVADSSGEIEVKDVAKDVTIERDSSGSIEVKNVGGDFTVGRDSSGGIKHKNVAGKVKLPG
ncbi:MAG: DUF4097 and DUF4098 domain-containing protein YvlB [Arenicella sp.]|jgi:DUF4097 and DUF4098 domain-containing protein YvlB